MTASDLDPLARYWAKRDFTRTAEPRGERAGSEATRVFVIQKHAASRLHYDFRLELDGVLVSWAVPKGPSFDPADKRMAIHVEDHPFSYRSFEGTIPPGQYGAGSVIVWDNGTWEPVGDPRDGMRQGKLVFQLFGQKLAGLWELVRIAKPGDRQEAWILFKKRDAFVRPKAEFDVVSALPDSVIAKPLTAAPDPKARGTSRTGRAGDPGNPRDLGNRSHAVDLGSASNPSSAKRASNASSATNASSASRTPGRASKPGQPASVSSAADATEAQQPARVVETPASLPGAVEAALPATFAPQLATLASGVPLNGTWVYEIKFDGYRLLARIEGGKAALFTRRGHDWSNKMPALVGELQQVGVQSAWLDGEIVVLGRNGAPDFNALQNAFEQRTPSDAIVFFVFDVPYLNGYDLRRVELAQRRALLKSLLAENGAEHLRFSADFEADSATILSSACRMGLEGVIAKRTDAPYVSRRTETWLKLKCKTRQEFVVCGYTDRTSGEAQIGSLLLGVHDANGSLVSVGSVGSGWNAEAAGDLKQMLTRLEVPKSPFADPAATQPGRWSKRAAGTERWVKPSQVAEVEFAEWTPDGQIRHAVFVGLRTDKPASAITREVAADPAALADDHGAAGAPRAKGSKAAVPARSNGSSEPNGPNRSNKLNKPKTGPPPPRLKVTNPERVIDPSIGLTKLDLVRYYESVADWLLPHLKGRPCSLVRGPRGVTGELFFQKHDEKIGIPGIRELDPALWPGHDALLEVATPEALRGAAQMNVIEFHTWNSTARNIEKPDRMIFDLDPGEGTAWPQIQEAAVLVRTLLSELDLTSWLKTSGGKGLHVVVPLAPRLDYDTVKDFSHAIVEHLAQTIPSRFVAKSGPANRVGRLFVDYLRNGRGATTASAFSARARAGLGVSMPVAWDDLPKLKSGAHWTVATAREHLSFETTDPWADYWKTKQALGAAMKVLGFKPSR